MAAGQPLIRRFAQQAAGGGQGKLALADAGQAVYQPCMGETVTLRQPLGRELALPGQELRQIAHGAPSAIWPPWRWISSSPTPRSEERRVGKECVRQGV